MAHYAASLILAKYSKAPLRQVKSPLTLQPGVWRFDALPLDMVAAFRWRPTTGVRPRVATCSVRRHDPTKKARRECRSMPVMKGASPTTK
jgi:hypothetical protein